MKSKTDPISVYQFKITLMDTKPPVWRRLQVKNDIKLSRLSAVLLTAMGWSGGHLHALRIGGKDYGIPDGFGGMKDERKVKLKDLSQNAIKKFEFMYDFGDGWEHRVQLEKVLEPEKGAKYPLCVDGARSCPPEDCGGPGGYENFLEAIKDPKHPEHEEMRDWIGGEFDAEAFDAKEVNAALAEVKEVEKQFDDFC